MEIEKINSKTENPKAEANLNKLSDLASEARIQESTSTGFMEPGTKQKGRAGRKPMTPEQKAEAARMRAAQKEQALKSSPTTTGGGASGPAVAPVMIPSKKIAEPAVKLLSKLGAGVAGHAKAEMTLEEIDDISMALGMVMDKWMPSVASQYGPELCLCVALSAWGTRVYAIRKVVEENTKAMKQAQAGDKPARPSDQQVQTVENISTVTQEKPASIENANVVDFGKAAQEFGPIPK